MVIYIRLEVVLRDLKAEVVRRLNAEQRQQRVGTSKCEVRKGERYESSFCDHLPKEAS
jgi:hypothetical protein